MTSRPLRRGAPCDVTPSVVAGETLLSPLVMCGPHGLKFLQPVELRLPHCASVNPDSWSFALKSSDSPTGMNKGNDTFLTPQLFCCAVAKMWVESRRILEKACWENIWTSTFSAGLCFFVFTVRLRMFHVLFILSQVPKNYTSLERN